MAGTVERFYKVTVDATEAIRQLQKIASSTAAVDAKLDAFAGTIKKIGVGLAAGFGAHAFIEKIKGLSEAFDQLGKDASKIGIGAEDLQRLRYAADLAGVSAEGMDKAITKLAVAMQHLGVASDDATTTLKAIGVTGGDSPVVALEKIADRFAALPDGVEKTAEAVALFGKSGADMIPMLNEGGAKLKELANEADRFGGIIEQKTIDQAEAFNDNLSRMEKTAAGSTAQLTAGLLPALDALAATLVELTTTGGGFRSTGEAIGELFVMLAKGAIYTSQILRTLGKDVAFVFSLLTPGLDIGELWDAFQQDLQETDDETKKLASDLDKAFAAAKTGAEAAGEAARKHKNAVQEAADAAKRAKDAEKALEEAQRKAQKAAEDRAKLEETYAKIAHETASALDEQKQSEIGLAAERAAGAKELDPVERRLLDLRNQQTNAFLEWKQAEEDVVANEQLHRTALDELEGKYDDVSVALRRYHQEALNGTDATKEHTDELKKQKTVAEAVGDGWDRFVDTLSQGSVNVSDAISAMARSIIADLLKIAAQKYIIQSLFGASSGGGGGGAPATQALGGAWAAGELVPFAMGGVTSGPLRVPMALMGEAWPEAIMPLKRTPDGRLGVAATGGSGALNVQIHNYAGAAISTRRDGAGDLQVLVEATKKSLAADVRRGGGDFARAAESAWRLSRGQATQL